MAECKQQWATKLWIWHNLERVLEIRTTPLHARNFPHTQHTQLWNESDQRDWSTTPMPIADSTTMTDSHTLHKLKFPTRRKLSTNARKLNDKMRNFIFYIFFLSNIRVVVTCSTIRGFGPISWGLATRRLGAVVEADGATAEYLKQVIQNMNAN